MRYQGFVGGSYESQAVTADAERTVNFYVERMESQGATTDYALYPTPGVELLSEGPTTTELVGAGFLWAQGGEEGEEVAFTDASTGSVVSRLWDFDDGDTSTETDPNHTYASTGVYVVTLTVQPGGDVATASIMVGSISSGTGTSATGPVAVESVDPRQGPGRAHDFLDGREFAVIGTTFYEVFENGTATARGTVATNENPATICGNGAAGGQLFVTSGGNGYVYDLDLDTLSQVAALNGEATMGGHLDGRFLALDANTAKLRISDLLDGTTWDPTQFAQRSTAPDPWVAMRVVGQFIWLWGQVTSEVWFDAGASPFPFQPHPSGRLIQYGIAAPFSSAVLGGEVVWLGATREGKAMVLRAAGFAPEVVSTYPVQSAITDYGTIEDALADGYSDRGHQFYLLTFPSQDVTWAWDSETNLWAERGTWIAEESSYSALRQRWHAQAFGEHRMLDATGGQIYRTSTTLPLDVDGRPLRRLRRAPALMDENAEVFYSRFELDLEPGLGTASGQGEDPQVMLRTSDDGGKTWGNEHFRSAGKLGEYFRRVQWTRLGSARRRVFEVSFSDPVPWRITNAYLDFGQPPGSAGQQREAQGR